MSLLLHNSKCRTTAVFQCVMDWGQDKTGRRRKEFNEHLEERKKKTQRVCVTISDIDNTQVKKLRCFLFKGLRPMWRSFAATYVQATVYVCVRMGEGALQELGNIDMAGSTLPSQQN